MKFPLGARITLAELEGDPHALLARLREREPVSWVPAIGGWLITRYDLAVAAMRDDRNFTVDDNRFSTAQVVGPSMLSVDGDEHVRHRAPFVAPFRVGPVRERFAAPLVAESESLIDCFAAVGAVELRRTFAGPLAATAVTRALGLEQTETASVLTWYREIVAAVTSITAGQGLPPAGVVAFAELRERLLAQIEDGAARDSLLVAAAGAGALEPDEIISNAAVLLFGGIETTEGMITNAILHLLQRPRALEQVRRDPALLDLALEESLRLEPAAAVIDRYATEDVEFGSVRIAAGELVRISISAANRDPEVFPNPGQLDLTGANPRRHLAFAQGPHVCVGVHLARLEARGGIETLLRRLPDLRLDPARPPRIQGLVFRKPPDLWVTWG